MYYGIQTARALENFPITGYKPHRELIMALVQVKEGGSPGQHEDQAAQSHYRQCHRRRL